MSGVCPHYKEIYEEKEKNITKQEEQTKESAKKVKKQTEVRENTEKQRIH